MKNAIATWKWSLGVLARSSRALLAVAAVAAVWSFGAYQWLWLPESSGLLLVLALIWAIVQIAVVAGFSAATVTAAAGVAADGRERVELRGLMSFGRRQCLRSLAWGAASLALILVFAALFKRSDDFALEVASFLTFHSEKAVHPVDVGKVFWVIQMLIWMVVGGFLLSFQVRLLREGWRESGRRAGRLLANSCWRAPFLTMLLVSVVFGGLAWLLANWHPKVPPGFWDYVQVLVRLGVALLLLAAGWLFALLSLARYYFPSEKP
ncbi:MAG: hypothetical protein ACE145_17070 [Terriglobia bacterium]